MLTRIILLLLLATQLNGCVTPQEDRRKNSTLAIWWREDLQQNTPVDAISQEELR